MHFKTQPIKKHVEQLWWLHSIIYPT